MGIVFNTGKYGTSPIYYPIKNPLSTTVNGVTETPVAYLGESNYNPQYNLPKSGGILVNLMSSTKTTPPPTSYGKISYGPPTSTERFPTSTQQNPSDYSQLQSELTSLQAQMGGLINDLSGLGGSSSSTGSSSTSPSPITYFWYIVAAIIGIVVLALMYVVISRK